MRKKLEKVNPKIIYIMLNFLIICKCDTHKSHFINHKFSIWVFLLSVSNRMKTTIDLQILKHLNT